MADCYQGRCIFYESSYFRIDVVYYLFRFTFIVILCCMRLLFTEQEKDSVI